MKTKPHGPVWLCVCSARVGKRAVLWDGKMVQEDSLGKRWLSGGWVIWDRLCFFD